MGVIFSPEAIENGHIPEQGAHQQAARLILDRLFPDGSYTMEDEVPGITASETGVELVMAYGSTVDGLAGLRSDVDMLFIYPYAKAGIALPAIGEAVNQARRRYQVPIEKHILASEALYDPLLHSIDPLFADHLLEVERDRPEWVRTHNSIVSLLSDVILDQNDDEALRTLAVRYTSGKLRELGDALSSYDGEPDLTVMRRSLELPSAIGRKILPATRKPGEATIPHISQKAQMVTETLARLERWAPQWHDTAAAQMRRLADLDQAYNQLLRSTLDGTASLPEYKAWLEENYLEACKQAYAVAYAWIDIIRSQADRESDNFKLASQEDNSTSLLYGTPYPS